MLDSRIKKRYDFIMVIEKIKKWRETKGLTQTAFAKMLDMDKELFSYYLISRKENENLLWPLPVARKISRITKGEITVEDFYPKR
jgi:transcriptional regulator with XRE-family HTH domain